MGRAGGGRAPFAVAAFIGSFLLFTLELIAAKLLLPSFGGAAYVWTTAMMVFQGLLFAGYMYAHGVLRRGRYGRAHLALLAVPLISLPIAVSVPAAGAPITRLLWALLGASALPFFVLSTTSTVLQGWLRRAIPGDEASVYSLYAASNAGSFVALLTYPLLIEPRMLVSAQVLAWTALYVVFVALHLPLLPACGPAEPGEPSQTLLSEKAAWVLLSMGPSAALLAATNLLALDFAAVPLLWVAPLAVYLATFVLNFKKNPWYPRRLSAGLALLMALWGATVLVTVSYSSGLPDGFDVIRRLWVVNKFLFVCASLFILCLICHRALAQSRPDAAQAPRYYAAIALGGWLGSVLIAVVMPLLARRLAMPELDWALAGALSFGALLLRDARGGQRKVEQASTGVATLVALSVLGAAGLGFYVRQSPAFTSRAVYPLPNVYGYYRVVDAAGQRRFFHGNTLHGLQSLDPALRREPLLYFSSRSPIAEVYRTFGQSLQRVGVMGLGVGMLAAYGRPGQVIDYYELDPDVERVARRFFTFLADTPARVTVTLGDARLSLGRVDARYDLIVLDAFTGGSIPVHMLTREAFFLYEKKLSNNGLIVAHITNRCLNLRPMLAALARAEGWAVAARQANVAERAGERAGTSWVVLRRDAAKIARLRDAGWEGLDGEAPARLWTDDYASLFSALRR